MTDIPKAIRKARRKVGLPTLGEFGWTISGDSLHTEGALSCSLPFSTRREALRERDQWIIARTADLIGLPLHIVLAAQELVRAGQSPGDALQAAMNREPSP